MTSARRAAARPSNGERELELKFAVGDVDAVRDLVSTAEVAGFEAGPWRSFDIVDQYLDTHSGALAKAGYGARLRHVDHRTLVTIKGARRPSGNDSRSTRGGSRRSAVHDRLELEARANRRLLPQRWPSSAARSLIEATAGDERLFTLFYVDQRREERELIADGTVVAKLSLDTASVRRFGRTLGSFVILEVEASAPDAAETRRILDSIANHLSESPELRAEERSKEQLAQAMVDQASERAHSVRPPRQPGVKADEPLAEAGRKVLRMHLLRMLVAEPGVRAGEDTETVHKMRVATRRMRAAWRVFDGAYRPRFQKRYVAELRGVASALGAVRDIDVQLERLDDYAKGLPGNQSAALQPLREELNRGRAEARADLLDLLSSSDYDDFISDYRAFVDTPGAGAANDAAERVRDVAAGRIWRSFEQLRAHETIVPFADVPALHAVRIDGKRLRYALEFFREILPPSADSLIADVTAMQDSLGMLNDSQIAADITRAWLLESAGSLAPAQRAAAGAYLKSSEADVARLRRSFRPLWRRVSGQPFRRRLALTVGTI
ncbi:MAG TPA: CHAD domain-containing protein [Candidatus Limnocylindrales bacterium]|nr:CHAD domain-containing protein [Candidatus Limnocylindrales bacterium]